MTSDIPGMREQVKQWVGLDYRTAMAAPVGEVAVGVLAIGDPAAPDSTYDIRSVRVVAPGIGRFTLDDPPLDESAFMAMQEEHGRPTPHVRLMPNIWQVWVDAVKAGEYDDLDLSNAPMPGQ